MTTAGEGDTLATLVQLRNRTDLTIGSKWILFPIASYLLWASLAIVFLTGIGRITSPRLLIGVLGTLAFMASTGQSYLVYRLISRHNNHSAREQMLLGEALNVAKSRTRQGDLNILIPLGSTERDFSGLLEASRERSGILWGLLVLIPYAGWIFQIIALSLLSQDSNRHDQMEGMLVEDLDRTLKALGSSSPPLIAGPFYSRNTGASALASILTFGVFSFYWLYEMLRDPEAHFRNHLVFEDSLLRALSDASPSPLGSVRQWLALQGSD